MDFRDKEREDIFILHEVGAVVEGPCAVAEVFFPDADGDHAAAPVMVAGAEKGVETVLATIAWCIPQRVTEDSFPFFQRLVGKMQFLTVAVLRSVNSVEQSCHAGDQRQPRQGSEISRSVQLG